MKEMLNYDWNQEVLEKLGEGWEFTCEDCDNDILPVWVEKDDNCKKIGERIGKIFYPSKLGKKIGLYEVKLIEEWEQ